MHDAGAAAGLGMPDLRAGGEFEIGHHHLVALAGKIEGAGQRIEPGRYRGGDGDLVGSGIQQRGHALAHRLVLADPQIPVGAEQQAILHIGVEGGLDAVGQRAIGAAIEIGLARQHGKLAPQRGKIRGHDPTLHSKTAAWVGLTRDFRTK